MKSTAFSQLFLPRGALSGRAFLGLGLILFLCKYTLDYLLARFGFGYLWAPTDYFLPRPGRPELGAGLNFPAAISLTIVALPFVWVGVNLTLRRLRTLGWPPVFACLFFFPYANFIFFALLAFHAEPVNPPAPVRLRTIFTSRTFLICLLTFLSTGLVLIATFGLEVYGFGLFIGVPFFTGFIPAITFQSKEELSFRNCFTLTLMTQCAMAICLVLVKAEGAICILMCAPLFLLFGAIGAAIGLAVRQISLFSSAGPHTYSPSFLLVLLAMFIEWKLHPTPTLFKISSSIEVSVPRKQVWQSIVAFSQLPPPEELIFRAGLAYPIRAEIHGQGVGAVRHCIFSTGAFVEPIIVWNQPELLRFTVVSNPPPMRELSFFDVRPPHLHGFLESEQGQFLLEELPNGRTKITGSTWYRHGLFPEAYWRLWSDYIIHTIHRRVLRHIKSEAENLHPAPGRTTGG